MSIVIDLAPTLDSHKLAGVNDPYPFGRDWLVVTDLMLALGSHKPIGVNDPYRKDRLSRQLRIRNDAFLMKQW